jgi:hypothetical protein
MDQLCSEGGARLPPPYPTCISDPPIELVHSRKSPAKPRIDDALCLGARGSVGNPPLRVDGNVEASCPHAHRRSIRGIEPSIQIARRLGVEHHLRTWMETPSSIPVKCGSAAANSRCALPSRMRSRSRVSAESTASRSKAPNRQAAIDVILEHDVLARAVRAFVRQEEWVGTASELLDVLGPTIKITTPKILSDELARLAPMLRTVGFDIRHKRTADRRQITIVRQR